MSPNNNDAKRPVTSYKQYILSWLAGIATTATVGSFAFAWNTNVSVALLLERDREKTEKISAQQIVIDNLQIARYDVNSRLSNLEKSIQNNK